MVPVGADGDLGAEAVVPQGWRAGAAEGHSLVWTVRDRLPGAGGWARSQVLIAMVRVPAPAVRVIWGRAGAVAGEAGRAAR